MQGRCRIGGFFDVQSLIRQGGYGGRGGSGTLVASCNYFPSLTGCSFLQTNPMSLCPLALDSDQLQAPGPQGDSPFKLSFRVPLMCASPSLGTRSVDYQVLSFKSGLFQVVTQTFQHQAVHTFMQKCHLSHRPLLRPKEVQGDRCLTALCFSEGRLIPKAQKTKAGE